ncbi:MAG: Na/Pi cotransporter family protein [Spirochaetales bacterium]|nr:Na/Pi cotransporter family protein [Spirochaetales bacterium]
MDIFQMIIQIVGSVGLFLYGMQMLSDGLQKAAGAKLKSILGVMTSNRVMGVITGLIITLIIQSSSATTVMVVSFVSAGLMTLRQAIGVILGANIGTTVTAWVISLLGFKMNISMLALASIAISLPLLFSKNTKKREFSEVLMGFGLLFIGIEFLQSSMPDVTQYPGLLQSISRFNSDSFGSLIICVIVGALLTCIVQSSSATMAITITLAYEGWLGVYAACALCLGQNIGTTITAFIASLGTGTSGKRAALAHTLFNVVGSLIAIIVFKPFLALVNAITPGDIFTANIEALRELLPIFLSMFHTVFNLVNTAIFLPFTGKFANLIEHLIPDTVEDDGSYRFKYIASNRVDTPEFYLIAVKTEIEKMANITKKMFTDYEELCFKKGNVEDDIKELKKAEDYADQMQEQLIDFCVKMLQDSQSPTNAAVLQKMIRIIDETESITDSIFNMAKLNESKRKDDLHFSERAKDDLKKLNTITGEFINLVFKDSGNPFSAEDLLLAGEYENRIDSMHDMLSERCHDNLADRDCNIKSEMLYLEVIRHLEHIGDFCHNIAQQSSAIKSTTPSFSTEK